MNLRTRRRLRWAVPAAVVAVTAGVSSLSRVLPAGADPSPVLPALTPAQLLDKVHNASVTTLSGDIRLSSNLGLPDLGSLGLGGGSLLDLLSGSHTAHLWVDGPEHVRVALDSPQAENDWIRNGNDLWSWDSASQHVTHTTLTDGAADDSANDKPDTTDGAPMLDPVAAADQLLASIDPTTAVTVQTPGYVAGRPVYELVVSPRSDKSTIGDGVISVDAATGIPLAVRIDARGATNPALQVTFTSVSFDKPDASTFAFTPPPGAVVDQTDGPAGLLPIDGMGHRGERRIRAAATGVTGSAPATATRGGPQVTTIGTAWESVAVISGFDIGRQFGELFANSATIPVGSHTAHVVSTSLVNVLVLDDGRIAVAAMTPDAIAAAVAGQ
jgi:outer membrane lipoprotein-sorting protein